MGKVHVKTKIESIHEKHDFSGPAVMIKNKIVYYDEKIKTSILFGDKVEITRVNNNVTIFLQFVPVVQATCKLEREKLTLPMKLELSYIKQGLKTIDIHYKLEDETFKFHLEYEVIK